MSVEEMEALVSIGLAGMFFALLFMLVMYLLLSIGLHRMATNRGIENAWLAWVPVGNVYITGKLASREGERDYGMLAVWIVLGNFVLTFIPFLGILSSLATAVFLFILYFKVYELYTKNAALHLILSIFIAPYSAILIFIKRNEPVNL